MSTSFVCLTEEWVVSPFLQAVLQALLDPLTLSGTSVVKLSAQQVRVVVSW